MSYYTIEQWTIKDVAYAFREQNGDENRRRVIIPIFQRGKRWDNGRRTDFIDSLLRGYPFGSLLFAKHDNNTYSVVDGLQRGTTVCDYVYNPLSKNNFSYVDEDILNNIRLILFPGNLNYSINVSIKNIILEYLYEKKTFEKVDRYELSELIQDSFPSQEDGRCVLRAISNALRPFLEQLKSMYDNICSVIVPIIVYSGPNELLSDIFNRINVKGISLNDYEIYAAVWDSKKKTVNNSEIVQYAVNKYIAVTQEGYEIDGFDANAMLARKELTAFEYFFGLGKYWIRKFECLQIEKDAGDDKVSEIGFEIVDACISDTKDISNLDKAFHHLNMNKLQRRIEEAIAFVLATIAEVGEFKGNTRKFKVLHSKYQIISLISFTFRQMYDLDNLDLKRTNWESFSAEYKKRMLSHYIADIITNEWHEGGGNKVYFTAREERYLDTISRSRWETIFDGYYQKQLSNAQTERFPPPTNADSIILNCIYADIFSAREQLSTLKFDIDHIAIDNNILYIFDSKYYTQILGLNYKQFSYNEILRYRYLGIENIHNILLLPGDERAEVHFSLASDYVGLRAIGTSIIEQYLPPKRVMKNYLSEIK